MRIHLPTLPHTLPTLEYLHCAYSQKLRLFAQMMRSLGHDVFVYESVEPLAPADNLSMPFDVNHPKWQRHNAATIAAMRPNVEPRDIICLIAGVCHQPIAAAFPQLIACEFGVGYSGIFAPYCVFESYAHQANVYGQRGITDGRFFDAVIPNYYDPADFPLAESRDDYLLFIGRLNQDKGVQVAVETAKATERRLVVAGQGTPPAGCDYRGVVGVRARADLMSRAHAVLVPTLYLEPFGGVAVEAQLCGTPVLTTDWGAFPETVIQGVTGLRCHTLGEFVEGVDICGRLDRPFIQKSAQARYSMHVVKQQYQRYFERLALLWERGWYTTACSEMAATHA